MDPKPQTRIDIDRGDEQVPVLGGVDVDTQRIEYGWEAFLEQVLKAVYRQY